MGLACRHKRNPFGAKHQGRNWVPRELVTGPHSPGPKTDTQHPFPSRKNAPGSPLQNGLGGGSRCRKKELKSGKYTKTENGGCQQGGPRHKKKPWSGDSTQPGYISQAI